MKYHPRTRAGRLAAIQSAIESNEVISQQQLSQELAEHGFDVTQATLSRDLDELGAFKARNSTGLMRYVLPSATTEKDTADNYQVSRQNTEIATVLSGLIMSVATAQNQVVIHTSSGAAQYVASVIDAERNDNILGSIAGDDTVLVIAADGVQAQKYTQLLLSTVGNSRG